MKDMDRKTKELDDIKRRLTHEIETNLKQVFEKQVEEITE